jgi:hypothetical protein
VTFTPHEFTLFFGHFAIPPLPEAPGRELEVPVQPLVTVALPLNMVRGLVDVLQRQLEAWETNFGSEVPGNPVPREQPSEENQ